MRFLITLCMDSIYLAVPAFIIGILFLYKGSDILVDGTSKTAIKLGISSLIISVVVVGFGTSAPEFAISVGAAIQNQPDISLGNIVGSCIANLLLVLGIGAIINPIKIKKGVLKREYPIVINTTIVLFVFSIIGLLDKFHIVGGVIFLILSIVIIIYFIKRGKEEQIECEVNDRKGIWKNILFIILGIVGVVAGAWLLIDSSITIAEFFGIPSIVIALSMVAIGTSLPELVVSAMAAYRENDDIAIGNVVGSNIFNIFLILGFAALFIPLNAFVSLDHIIILLGITFVMIPIFYFGKTISRLKGVLLLIFYSCFIWYIFFF